MLARWRDRYVSINSYIEVMGCVRSIENGINEKRNKLKRGRIDYLRAQAILKVDECGLGWYDEGFKQ